MNLKRVHLTATVTLELTSHEAKVIIYMTEPPVVNSIKSCLEAMISSLFSMDEYAMALFRLREPTVLGLTLLTRMQAVGKENTSMGGTTTGYSVDDSSLTLLVTLDAFTVSVLYHMLGYSIEKVANIWDYDVKDQQFSREEAVDVLKSLACSLHRALRAAGGARGYVFDERYGDNDTSAMQRSKIQKFLDLPDCKERY